jgi:hypothetical protein
LTDLAVVDPAERAIAGMRAAEELFTPDRRAAIARFLDIEPEDPGFIPYLAVCAKYGLDPVMGEIWLIPQSQRGEDGQQGEKKLRPSVGAAGYLSIARRTPEYEGMVDDVVHGNDSFRVLREIDLETGKAKLAIRHEYPDLQDAPEDDKIGFRGPVIGAYAVVYVTGQRPTYYFADLREHGKKGERRDGAKYWKGSWGYTSAMILKSARSHALRSALGITGIVPADELREDDPEAVEEKASYTELAASIPGAGSDLQEELLAAVLRANELGPWAWTPAKVQMVMGGRAETQLRAILEDIQKSSAAAEAELASAEEVTAEPVPEEEQT